MEKLDRSGYHGRRVSTSQSMRAGVGRRSRLRPGHNPYPPEKNTSLGPRLAALGADWVSHVTVHAAKTPWGSYGRSLATDRAQRADGRIDIRPTCWIGHFTVGEAVQYGGIRRSLPSKIATKLISAKIHIRGLVVRDLEEILL